MSDKKISVVLLGKKDSLKETLITNIMEKDLSEITKTSVLKKTQLYENDTYLIFCTPDLYKESEDIKELFVVNQNIDMSLLLVEDGFSEGEVQQQIEELGKTTAKPTEEFRVVLPFSHNQSDNYQFKFLTTDQVLKELGELDEKRGLVPTFERSNDDTGSSTSTQETPMDVTDAGTQADTPINLILLGMSGTGKSASGNTILGKNHFTSTVSSLPVTREFQVVETVIDGKRVDVIDTPDMFGDDIKQSVKNKHVKKCREFCQPGPSVFVLVMHVSRFTDCERDIMKKLKKAFGPRVHEQTVILFTRGDDLKREGMSLDDFLSSCQPDLKKIVEECENRCVVFENRTSDSQQVRWLMQKVENVLEKQQELCVNRPQSYSCMAFSCS